MDNHTFSPDWPDDFDIENFRQISANLRAELDNYRADAFDYLLARLTAREREIAELRTKIEKKIIEWTTGKELMSMSEDAWGETHASELRAVLSPHPPAVEKPLHQMCTSCKATDYFPGGLFTIWSAQYGESSSLYHWRDNKPCGPVIPYKPAVDRKE